MAAIMHRKDLTNAWSKRFQGMKSGYWITLNSKFKLNGLSDYRVPSKVIDFDTSVKQYIHQLNEFCFGRNYIRKAPDAKLCTLVGYEIGNANGLLHAHIVAGHIGNTNRTIEQVSSFSNWKWSKQYSIEGSDQFVHVESMDNANDRIWYITKQSETYQQFFGETNLTTH